MARNNSIAEILQVLTKLIEQDVSASRSLASSALEMARSAKQTDEIIQLNLNAVGAELKRAVLVFEKTTESFEKKYTPLDRFTLVERTVYGMIGFIIISFLGALTFLVFQSPL